MNLLFLMGLNIELHIQRYKGHEVSKFTENPTYIF